MKPVILFRAPDASYGDEIAAASKYFDVIHSRMHTPKDALVIGRYSVLPFYKELEEDLQYNGSQLINTYRMHRYIADISAWYMDFEDITPRTWFRLQDIPKNGGPYVLKGETNSRKYDWLTHMYAKDTEAAGVVYSNLMRDSLIGSQNICIREYVPLRTLKVDVTGLPITEEYRFFILYGKVISSGFYWSSHYDQLRLLSSCKLDPKQVPQDFLDDICERVKDRVNAVVVDIARKADGGWIVIELNDLQQSGLSENDADTMYKNLRAGIDDHISEL